MKNRIKKQNAIRWAKVIEAREKISRGIYDKREVLEETIARLLRAFKKAE